MGASAGTAAALVVWTVIDAAFLGVAPIPHTSYLAAISVQIAVLAGAGLVQAARLRQAGSWLARSALPVLLIAQTGWTAFILHASKVAPTFLLPVVAVLGLCAAVAGLAGIALGRRTGQAAWSLAVVAVLVAPAVWSAFNITTVDGAYGDAHGGPAPVGPYAGRPAWSNGGQPFQVDNPLTVAADPRLGAAQQALVGYLLARTDAGTLMPVDAWWVAQPYILDAGVNVLPMGGCSGQAPTPSVGQLAGLISADQLDFVLLRSMAPGPPTSGAFHPESARASGAVDGPPVATIRQWVDHQCSLVPPTAYEGTHLHLTGETLYRCGTAVAENQ